MASKPDPQQVLDRYVRELVAKAPPLTPEQKDRLSVILRANK